MYLYEGHKNTYDSENEKEKKKEKTGVYVPTHEFRMCIIINVHTRYGWVYVSTDGYDNRHGVTGRTRGNILCGRPQKKKKKFKITINSSNIQINKINKQKIEKLRKKKIVRTVEKKLICIGSVMHAMHVYYTSLWTPDMPSYARKC